MKGNAYKKLGLQNPTSTVMQSAIDEWIALYRGEASWLKRNPQTLKLPARIASKIATTVTVESQVQITGSARADFLNDALEPVLEHLRINTEYACAMGGLVFKPYVTDGQICVDYVQADDFYPVSYNSRREITAAIFVERKNVGDKIYKRLEYHRFEGTQYIINNKAYIGYGRDDYAEEVPLTMIEEWRTIRPEVHIDFLEKPLFGYLRIPVGNTIDPKSPVGTSVYANAVGMIEEADRQYQRLLWEYEGSELAIDASEDCFTIDIAGDPKLPEGKERLYRTNAIDPKQTTGDNIFKVFSPAIRDEAYMRGLNTLFKQIEDEVGIARGTLSDPNDVDRTATELVQNKQTTYATITSIQRALQKALEQLICAMDELASLYSLAPAGTYQTSFVWDDSVVVDAETERMRDREDIRDGIMQKWEYRVKWYGETPEQAKAVLAEGQQSDDDILGFKDREDREVM